MKKQEALNSMVEIADIHAQRLETALSHIEHLKPFRAETLASLNDIDFSFLELATSRFAKLQDIIGGKIFTLYLESLQEDILGKSFLDNLNKLEKLHVIPSTNYWIKMREIRNHVTHEYPDKPELMAINLNELIKYSYELLRFWKDFRPKIN